MSMEMDFAQRNTREINCSWLDSESIRACALLKMPRRSVDVHMHALETARETLKTRSSENQAKLRALGERERRHV